MLKNYLAFVFFFFLCNIYSQTTTIPDANFEQALIDLNIDTDGTINQSVATTDVSGVISINVSSYNIANLTGIEDFTSLTTLNCWDNQLTSLDLSQNTTLQYLSCQQNQLTSLNVNGAIALKEISCNINLISNLDASQNTALELLSCGSNPLTNLNVNGANNLTILSCGDSQLTSLDLSQNINLVTFFCGDNILTSLDISQNINLEKLFCYNNQLTSLDLSQNIDLIDLRCASNQLTSLDVKNGNNSLITYFSATNNPSLTCIQVDNETAANAGQAPYTNTSWYKDASATYSEDCESYLGIDNELLTESLKLYPNPVSNFLTIDSKFSLSKIEVYSILGQKVKDINSDFNSISTEYLSKGIYVIKIYSKKGTTVKKLIKE